MITETVSRNANWDEGGEKLIKENLIINDLECAIDCALMCGRTVEALLIAECGGNELFQATKIKILSNSKDQYLKNSVLHLLNKDLFQLAEHSDLQKWTETLGTLIVHSQHDIFTMATKLGDRLAEERSGTWPTIASYLVGNNLEKVL